MGNCCNCNNAFQANSDSQFSPLDDNILMNNVNNLQNNHNNHTTSEEKQNITETNQMKTWGEQKDTLMNKNNITMDKPDIIDEVFLDNDKLENSLNISIMDEKVGFNLSNMEKNLFDLINELRTNPKSFIDKIALYKDKLKYENDKYYISIDNNEFEFKYGKECFDECINFLKNQKNLEKFEKIQSMFECKQFFVDKNASDLLFVLIYNLIDINSPDDNKIRRNCLMSDEYNRLNITITKDEVGNNKFYSYYFSFDKF